MVLINYKFVQKILYLYEISNRQIDSKQNAGCKFSPSVGLLSQPASCFESSTVFSKCVACLEFFFSLFMNIMHIWHLYVITLKASCKAKMKGWKDIVYFNIIILNTFKINQILAEANKELIDVARRSQPSVLRQRGFVGMSSNTWMSEVLEELSTRCPTVNNILCALLESTIQPGKKNPAICLIYGIINFLRCHELSRIQRINSVMLTEGQASVNVSCIFILFHILFTHCYDAHNLLWSCLLYYLY